MPEVNAVFEAGGVRGIGLVGALAVLEKKGYTLANVAGTSAGSIVAALHAAGYSAREMKTMLMDLDFTSFMDPRGPDIEVLHPVEALAGIVTHLGQYRGEALEKWMAEHLAKNGVRTFADLRNPHARHESLRYKVRMIAADVTRGSLLVLPQDIAEYGVDPDEFEVARAVRMSCSIPFFFEPVPQKDQEGNTYDIVDGGLVSGFPVWLFDREDIRLALNASRQPMQTIGFHLGRQPSVPNAPYPAHPVSDLVSMFLAVFNTALEARDMEYVQMHHESVKIISIDTLGIDMEDFNLTEGDKRRLFASGEQAGLAFVESQTKVPVAA